jgi:membrane protein insertase Oxa1/YidC/SpoIIIJ
MNAHTVNLISCVVIVLFTTWAVLTHKVRTNSLEILSIAMINMGAAISVYEMLTNKHSVTANQMLINFGIAIALTLYFIRVEIYPAFCKHFHIGVNQ